MGIEDFKSLLEPQKRSSVLYDGGGASNALQEKTASDDVVTAAAAAPAMVIPVGKNDRLDLYLLNTTAAQSCTVQISEFAGSVADGNGIRKTEVAVETTDDQTGTVDQSDFGLASGTQKKPKQPVRVAVTPGCLAVITIASTITGAWYGRYQLVK